MTETMTDTSTDTTPLTVDQVLARMRDLTPGFPPADGVGVFHRMYLTVTELVAAKLDAGYFADPAALAVLDALFAGRYLAAVDADAVGSPRRPAGDRSSSCAEDPGSTRCRPRSRG